MKIEMLKIEEVIPYENNPRINEKAVQMVADSINEFGFKVPIVIDENNVIVTGHTRLKAAIKLGLEEVPCIKASDLNETQIKAFRLADNKTAELAEWDMEKLDQELRQLAEMEIDMSVFDFKLMDIEPKEDNFDLEKTIEEVKKNTISKTGDIWKLGRHRLMCGDSTKKKDFEKLMDGHKVKLVITDPPYNVNYESVTTGMKIENDQMDDSSFRNFLRDAYKRMIESMMPGAPIYVFHADTEGYNFRGAFKEAGLKLSQNLVWVKNSLVPGYSDYQWKHEPILYGWKEGGPHYWYGNRTNTTVYEDLPLLNPKKMTKPQLVDFIKDLQDAQQQGASVIYHDKPGFNDDHPTMKPVKLLAKLIFNSSERGDSILDSFGGSGSTLIAADQTGRTAYTMELDPVYCDVIIKRYEELTGDKAELTNG